MDKHTVIRLLLILAAAFVLFLLISYYNSQRAKAAGAAMLPPASASSSGGVRAERFSVPQSVPAPYSTASTSAATASSSNPSSAAQPSEPLSNEQYRPVDYGTGPKSIKDCYPKDRLTTDDLLPKDAANTKWAQSNPAGQGDVKDQNFLTAGYLIGVNTVGQSLRNANMQLRSEPPNPQYKVSPWMQTTIEPDLNRRPLEVDGC
jgi:hypothetical protein